VSVVRRWRLFLSRLHLSRVGGIVFSVLAFLGMGLAVADDVLPRSGSEADLGPNIAAIVGVYTIVALGLVVVVDRGCQAAARITRRSRS
jgi:hypothetical protein